MKSCIVLAFFIQALACNPPVSNKGTANASDDPQGKALPVASYTGSLPIDRIKLPPGFKIGVFAEGVENARSMALGSNGTLFVGTRDAGVVHALRDTNGDYVADVKYVLAKGLRQPNGVAIRDGALFVAEISRILRFDDIENRLTDPGQPVVVTDRYPTEDHHGWKYIAFGPDGKLYVPVGAPCNICNPNEPIYCTITRINADGSNQEIYASGIRNSVGFDWHPRTGNLWFTENGRDWLGDDQPGDELNVAPQKGLHFGYPFCHQGNIPDPKYGDERTCSEFTPPVQVLAPHTAALGMEFYTGNQFPDGYKNQPFIAEHGSWNRTQKIGYRIMVVKLDENGRSNGYEEFATGWLNGNEVWGRPVDVEVLPDGSLLVSDDYADAIYRIYYAP